VVFTAPFAGADVIALQQHRGITGVAWATLITYSAMGVVALSLALRALGLGVRARVQRVLVSYWGLAVALLLAPLAQRFSPWAGGTDPLPRILHAVVGSATFLLAYAVLVGPLLRGLGLRQIVSELNLPFSGWVRRSGNGSGPPA